MTTKSLWKLSTSFVSNCLFCASQAPGHICVRAKSTFVALWPDLHYNFFHWMKHSFFNLNASVFLVYTHDLQQRVKNKAAWSNLALLEHSPF